VASPARGACIQPDPEEGTLLMAKRKPDDAGLAIAPAACPRR